MTDCVKIIEVVEQPTRVVDVAQAVGGTGLSAFQLAVEGGYVGTVQDWLASLVGDTGLSAYEVAVSEGFTGTVEDWLTSLTGPAGASAYDVAADEGFPGSVEDWLASLKGDAGASAYDLWLDAGNTGTVNDFLNSLVGPAGVGVPTGGTSGQVLAKTSGTDFDTEWVAPPAAPVTSVNSETGDVVLDAGDVGAAPIVHGHTASDVSGLATVATSGSYDDLTDTPGPGFSGDYDDLANKPSIPAVPGDIGAQPAGDYATGAQGDLADTAVQPNDLAAVATSGSYDDLGDKPTIPTQASDVGAATASQGLKADSAVQPGDLAAVATSGKYSDLTGKPVAILEPAQDGTSGQALVTDGDGGRSWETISGGGATLPDGDATGDVLTWDGDDWEPAQPEVGYPTRIKTAFENLDGDGTITLAAGYQLLRFEATNPCRFRLYTDTTHRALDVGRPVTQDPTGDHGCVFEAVASVSLLEFDIGFPVNGFTADETTTVPYRVDDGPTDVTLTWVRTQ